MAVVQASSYSSDSTPSLGTSTGAALKKNTYKKQTKKTSAPRVVFKTGYPAVVLRGLCTLSAFLLSDTGQCQRQAEALYLETRVGEGADSQPGQRLPLRWWWWGVFTCQHPLGPGWVTASVKMWEAGGVEGPSRGEGGT